MGRRIRDYHSFQKDGQHLMAEAKQEGVIYPINEARISAGISIDDLIKTTRFSRKYLLEVMRVGTGSMETALALAKMFNCDAQLFIRPKRGLQKPKTGNQKTRRTVAPTT